MQLYPHTIPSSLHKIYIHSNVVNRCVDMKKKDCFSTFKTYVQSEKRFQCVNNTRFFCVVFLETERFVASFLIVSNERFCASRILHLVHVLFFFCCDVGLFLKISTDSTFKSDVQFALYGHETRTLVQ